MITAAVRGVLWGSKPRGQRQFKVRGQPRAFGPQTFPGPQTLGPHLLLPERPDLVLTLLAGGQVARLQLGEGHLGGGGQGVRAKARACISKVALIHT